MRFLDRDDEEGGGTLSGLPALLFQRLCFSDKNTQDCIII